MAGKPVYVKLRMTEGSSVLVLNSPGDYEQLIGSVPEQVEFLEPPQEDVDFVHFFAHNKAELDAHIDLALASVKYDGLLWISYPKGSSKVETDINRDSIWEYLKAKDIRPVMQVSIDETWSALRFRPQEAVGT